MFSKIFSKKNSPKKLEYSSATEAMFLAIRNADFSAFREAVAAGADIYACKTDTEDFEQLEELSTSANRCLSLPKDRAQMSKNYKFCRKALKIQKWTVLCKICFPLPSKLAQKAQVLFQL